jgi:hypothetical protein
MKIIGSLLMGGALLGAFFLGSADAIGTKASQKSYQADWYAINQELSTGPGVEMAEQELGHKTGQKSYQTDWYAINQELSILPGGELAGTGGGAQNLAKCDGRSC